MHDSKIFLQSPHCAENRLQHVRSSDPGAVMCKSRATHPALITCNMSSYVPHGMKGQLSYQVWQSLNRIYLSFILWAEPLTDEGGEETGVPGENPWRQASEKSENDRLEITIPAGLALKLITNYSKNEEKHDQPSITPRTP